MEVEAGLWKAHRQRIEAVHVWRERRAAFGELVMMDSSEFRWLEERAGKLHLIAMIDDATSRFWGRFVEHDSTEENLRTLEERLRRLEQILSVREARSVANDYTVRWAGQRWAIPRAEMRPELRGPRVQIERRLDGSVWVRFPNTYLSLTACPAATPILAAGPSGLRPPGLNAKNQQKNQIRPPSHSPVEEDTSTLQKTGHFYSLCVDRRAIFLDKLIFTVLFGSHLNWAAMG